MKMLMVAPFVYNDSTEDFLANGFRELGWKVVRQQTRFLREAPDPDSDIALTFVVKSSPLPVDQLPGKTMLYVLDNLVRKPEQLRQSSYDRIEKEWAGAAQYDHILLAHELPGTEGSSIYRFFPVGYDPSTHYWDGKGLPKTTDVCFIGTCHRPSREWITHIPNIEIYGNDWDALRYPIYNVEKRRQVYQTKVNINQHIPHDTVNMRQFEVTAMHGFLLSDTAWPFEDGKEIATYKDPKDCKKQVAYWLEEEDEREKIAEAGHKAVQQYSYADRIKLLLREVGL